LSPACQHRPISLLALDVDRFKSINDTYGHQAGDKVLQELAGIIQSNIRNSDLAARIGGEEYALLMPDADSPAAVVVARKIKRAVETHTFMLEDKQVSVTISVGICTLAQPPCSVDVGKLYSFADQALYHSKNSGRNSISIYDPESSTIAKIA
jgi:diguanylate cyclase (GGDEF)-like protein